MEKKYARFHLRSYNFYQVVSQSDMILTSMNSPFTAARYHSLVIEQETFPHDALEATAWTEDGLIMAARHKKYRHIQVYI